ncbi:non-homologous end-joining DNA ligase [Actinoplanes sp. NPDC048796]|uniref:non-homologous end-joining DNA ligase n=1 Tax=Actinoplanes sp. NPDC048796 TaxID=3155640 RepID=UPI0033CB26C1
MTIDGEVVRPMLAALGPLPTGPGWAFEFKYDGVRAVTYAAGGEVRALTRNDNDVTTTYPELAEIATLLDGRQAILDGEIVALEAGERPSFALLQNRMHVAAPPAALLHTVPIRYYVFDVLRLDGESTIDLPYRRRRELLAALRLDGATVRTPANFPDADGTIVLDAAKLSGFEGVVAKREDGVYRPGRRSPEWTKVPLIRTQEVLIVGYEPGEGRRSGTIGSLLLAVPDQEQSLRYAGQVGTGFTDAMLQHLQAELDAARRTTAPVPGVPRDHARHARWVEPTLVGEVAFRNWTVDGRLRHASWRGLRPDRDPSSLAAPPRAATPTQPATPPTARPRTTPARPTQARPTRAQATQARPTQAQATQARPTQAQATPAQATPAQATPAQATRAKAAASAAARQTAKRATAGKQTAGRETAGKQTAGRETAAREEVTGTVMTADATWRVEAVRRDGRQWYRIVHGDNVVEGLTLDDVRLVLEKAGIDLADLTEAA